MLIARTIVKSFFTSHFTHKLFQAMNIFCAHKRLIDFRKEMARNDFAGSPLLSNILFLFSPQVARLENKTREKFRKALYNK